MHTDAVGTALPGNSSGWRWQPTASPALPAARCRFPFPQTATGCKPLLACPVPSPRLAWNMMLANRKVGANWPIMEGDLAVGCGNCARPTSQLQGWVKCWVAMCCCSTSTLNAAAPEGRASVGLAPNARRPPTGRPAARPTSPPTPRIKVARIRAAASPTPHPRQPCLHPQPVPPHQTQTPRLREALPSRRRAISRSTATWSGSCRARVRTAAGTALGRRGASGRARHAEQPCRAGLPHVQLCSEAPSPLLPHSPSAHAAGVTWMYVLGCW